MTYDPQAQREWWAERWFDVMETFSRTLRSGRAHAYARDGNVLSIEFKGGKVQAQVQGTAPEPYQVSVWLDPFTKEDWDVVVTSMAARAAYSAKLLAGIMPQDIEQVFTGNGLSLFPLTKQDVRSRCNCPDKARVCKHIGAVYYLLGDRFSEDPFVLFQMRGRNREQIIQALREKRQAVVETQAAVDSQPTDSETETTDTAAPSTAAIDFSHFWQYNQQLESSLVVITPPANSETVLDTLGDLPIRAADGNTAKEQTPMEYLRSVYQTVSQQAMLAAMRND